MPEHNSAALVTRYWRLMDAADFTGAAALLADEYTCDWPQSRERIHGRENFVAVNAHYPGRWRIALRRLIASGDHVATEVVMTSGDQILTAVSFFEVHDGKIMRESDYWPEPYDAPAWRAAWVEPMEPR
jgi:ketosteroid isomerase-like protein